MKKRHVSGEAALLFAILIDSMGVALMTKADFGISSISSVPYAVHQMLPVLSLGTWTYIFQTLLVVSLMVLTRRFNVNYLFAFVMGVFFGKMLDVHMLWIQYLPDALGWRISYMAVSFCILAVGICLSNNSGLPIVPTDTFPRDLSQILGKGYPRVKTTFDLICLTATAAISLFGLHRLAGIGIGTVVCACFTGKAIGLVQKFFDRYVVFERKLAPQFLRTV